MSDHEQPEPAAVYISPSELHPWKRNPRVNDHAVDTIAGLIQRFGWGSPILARAEDRMVIGGHTRLKAAAKLGLDRVPVRFLDLSREEAEAMAIADNKSGELADWDEQHLASVLKDIGETVSLDGLGFADGEIDGLLQTLDPEPPDAPETEGPPADPKSKRGEVYALGPHRLMCGDCRDAEDWSTLVGEDRINVCFTSPPYASQRNYDESSGFKPIQPDEYVDWWDPLQALVAQSLAPDGSFFVNIKEHCEGGQRHLYVKDLTIAHVRRWGWLFVDELCWVRGGVPGKWPNRLKNAWEPVLHFSMRSEIKLLHENIKHESADVIEYSPDNKKTHSGFVSGSSGGRRAGMALPSNVIKVHSGPHQIADAETKHTATFPVGLPEFFIRAYSDAGDLIADPFLGSGTTLIAAARQGRRCYGMEISPAYCDVIRKRWGDYARAAGVEPGPDAL